MLLFFTLAACFVAVTQAGCPMRPTAGQTSARRTPGDGGYRILISGSSDKYIPNSIYTISVKGSRTHERLQQFTRFTLSVHSQHAPNNYNARVGYFQLFPDSLTTFNEDCINTISEATDYPKSEIQVMWSAPPAGSGCVVFTSMILENNVRWYAEDDALKKTFCEISSSEVEILNDDPKCCACDEAKYSLTMEGIWSNTTHPKDFPISIGFTHFSDVIGASHEPGFSFWGRDHIASDGFRQLAEWGSASAMEGELRTQANRLKTLVKAAGLWYPNVNSNTTTNFKVDKKHPLLSAASMLGPSPDWVVGVSKLNLCQKDCTWTKSMVIDLYPWDAGTDNGISYMSPNSETKPREKMKPITTSYPEDPRSPFYDPSGTVMLPVARFYLNREKIVPHSCDEEILQRQISELEVTENTEDTIRQECLTTDYSPWTSCSVSCGKGLRMRTRSYRMPEKAAMFNCNRQLVSKELCVASLPECPGEEEQDNDTLVPTILAGCETTEWSDWTQCSSSCGIGVKIRLRRLKYQANRKLCSHVVLVNRDRCIEEPCSAGTEERVDSMCKVTPWSDWSTCSASCGKGVKLRTRLLMVDPSKQEECSTRVELLQQRPCLIQSDCTFDMATAKVVCMEKTDVGSCPGYYQRWTFDSQKMMCVPFIYSGCRGNRNNFLTAEECNNTCSVVQAPINGLNSNQNVIQDQPTTFGPPTPIDCEVSPWSAWSACSVSCGAGRLISYRTIQRNAEHGGRPCPRKIHRRARCQLAPCD